MRASIILPVFAAAVMAQSSSGDDFPQTRFLTQTNSLGVVTGQPSAETSIPNQPPADTDIPAVETSVGIPNNIPAIGTGVTTIPAPNPNPSSVNATISLVVSANNSTTLVLSTVGVGASATKGASGTDASKTGPKPTGTDENGTPTDASGNPESTGAAATMRAVAGSVVGVGAFVAAFL